MALTSEELNFLVYRYLQESGECASAAMDGSEQRGQEAKRRFFSLPFKKTTGGDGDAARRKPVFLSAPAAAFLGAPFWEPRGAVSCHSVCTG